MKLLGMTNKLVYTGGTNDLNKSHNRAMAQYRFQDIQDFRDQYLAVKKACNKLGLRFGRCKEHAKAVLKDEGVTEPSQQQISKTLDKLEEEHHVILFIYKADRQKYGKHLEQKKKDLLQFKDPFPKTVADASRVLAG